MRGQRGAGDPRQRGKSPDCPVDFPPAGPPTGNTLGLRSPGGPTARGVDSPSNRIATLWVGDDHQQAAMFSGPPLEPRVPQDHPLHDSAK